MTTPTADPGPPGSARRRPVLAVCPGRQPHRITDAEQVRTDAMILDHEDGVAAGPSPTPPHGRRSGSVTTGVTPESAPTRSPLALPRSVLCQRAVGVSGRRSSAYMASILALISAVLIALVRLSVRGADTEIVGVEGVAMRILPSSLCGGAAVSGCVVFSNHAHM